MAAPAQNVTVDLWWDPPLVEAVTAPTQQRLRAAFLDAGTLQLVDPVTLVNSYENIVGASGSKTTFTLTKDSTGMYHYDMLFTQGGRWKLQVLVEDVSANVIGIGVVAVVAYPSGL